MSSIVAFQKDHPFSNFFVLRNPLVVKGIRFSTSEHLYQAMKFWYFDDSPLTVDFVRSIAQCSTPFKAKYLGSLWTFEKFLWQGELCETVLKFKERGGSFDAAKWDAVKIDVMRSIESLKFFTNSDCASTLRASGTAHLVERSATDFFWGSGSNNSGANHLGKILMELRASFPTQLPTILFQTNK